ncbi:uncharacterized protein BO80DRAFT_39081 [Aspergillus ibericus CBS 121593]|uniref:Altered inheritance of mitochondria protein 9, mitochondrial n=1 Tax=Aspergillus ibericus CBS 121593 TaxID=1448316 RepID=A0A395H5B5_9EURO|nr:hypothetical protein BO80DRAFT_39081 [Aspergillus ibericus CBS 121593]RAL02088.1 hypothetical protein BO80DRAFT_39081 [Aspergillus ibericus CBS 121593]
MSLYPPDTPDRIPRTHPVLSYLGARSEPTRPPRRQVAYLPSQFAFDPHSYTSGKWLRQDDAQRSSRHIDFDFDALCWRIISLFPDSDPIAKCEKVEGRSNRVFIFTLNNGKRVVAKLPFRSAGSPSLITRSEVATTEFYDQTSIPLPEIHDWSFGDGDENSIGWPYIIMDHAEGVPLDKKWPDMLGVDQLSCVATIYWLLGHLTELDYPGYGSLYFSRGRGKPDEQLLDVNPLFGLGPHCNPRYWDCGSCDPRTYHRVAHNPGPWQTLSEYSDALVDAGLSLLPYLDPHQPKRPASYGTLAAAIDLLQQSRPLLKGICADPIVQAVASPLLWHPNLQKRKVFVDENDPTVITAIIGWHNASVDPTFWHAFDTPDFASYIDGPAGSLCSFQFQDIIGTFVPSFAAPRSLGPDLFQPLLRSWRVWRDGVPGLCKDLSVVAQRWQEFGLEDPSPFPPDLPAVIWEGLKMYPQLRTNEILRDTVAGLLSVPHDGWVPIHRWEETKLRHDSLKFLFLGGNRNGTSSPVSPVVRVMTDEKFQGAHWPFELWRQFR